MSKQPEPKAGTVAEVIPECPDCGKPLPLCICDSIEPIESRIALLILQHPQEQDRALGTVTLWQVAQGTARGRSLDHRGGGHAAGRAREAAGYRGDAEREF